MANGVKSVEISDSFVKPIGSYPKDAYIEPTYGGKGLGEVGLKPTGLSHSEEPGVDKYEEYEKRFQDTLESHDPKKSKAIGKFLGRGTTPQGPMPSRFVDTIAPAPQIEDWLDLKSVKPKSKLIESLALEPPKLRPTSDKPNTEVPPVQSDAISKTLQPDSLKTNLPIAPLNIASPHDDSNILPPHIEMTVSQPKKQPHLTQHQKLSILDFLKSFWKKVTGKSQSNEASSNKTQNEAKTQDTDAANPNADNAEFQKFVNELSGCLSKFLKDDEEFKELMELMETDSDAAAERIYRLINEKHKIQRRNIEDSTLLIVDTMKKTRAENDDIQKKYFNMRENILEREKKVKFWGKVEFGAGMTCLAVGGATFAVFLFTMASGGTAAPLAAIITPGLAALSGLAGVTQGVSTITKGTLKYQNDKKTGETIVVREQREANHEVLKEYLERLRETCSSEANSWRMQRQLIESQAEASRMV